MRVMEYITRIRLHVQKNMLEGASANIRNKRNRLIKIKVYEQKRQLAR